MATSPAPPVEKVVVLLKATGDAPILKQSKFKVSKSEKFVFISEFLRKNLKLEQVFMYLNSSFSPALNERIGTLHEAYNVDGKLVVNYSTTPAWG
mmetsp:Transcript_6576/g.12028  ORF Transcript_6576/g.12028 Transcript_6576/m.12028 type:complete len:95 (-) Transcript_6576:239-523(-)